MPEPGTAAFLLGLAAATGAVLFVASRGRVRGGAWALVGLSLVSLLVAQLGRHQVGFGPFDVVFAVLVAAVTLEPHDVGWTIGLSAAVLGLMWVTGASYPAMMAPDLCRARLLDASPVRVAGGRETEPVPLHLGGGDIVPGGGDIVPGGGDVVPGAVDVVRSACGELSSGCGLTPLLVGDDGVPAGAARPAFVH